MLGLTKKPNPVDEKWTEDAEKIAEHRAKIFIDAGNHEKAAEALHELPYKKSLLFLYNLGKSYLHYHDRRAETVVKASELIKKIELQKKDISLSETKFPHGNHVPIFKKQTISDIFSREV
jgi:hypothetical protein